MTHTLILMRHAKSSWGKSDIADHDRPLNERGIQASKKLGIWLQNKKSSPDEALISSARRTQETFFGLNLKIEPTIKRSLYLASSDQLIEALAKATGKCVILIAHNPGIAELALRLARMMRQSPSHKGFTNYPTGATFIAQWDTGSWQNIDWSQGKITEFIIPRELT